MKKKKDSRYQVRMYAFTGWVWVYVILGAIFLWFDYQTGAWIYYSTLFVALILAKGFDAVYDSLLERINIQSEWLDKRFRVLEIAVNSKSGQVKWKDEGMPTEDHDSYYFDSYPEFIPAFKLCPKNELDNNTPEAKENDTNTQ